MSTKKSTAKSKIGYDVPETGVVRQIRVGLVDADLLDNGTRHPNLALLKLAGFLNDNNIDFKLIEDADADVSEFDRIYVSKVFSFTNDPILVTRAKDTLDWSKFHFGGTGYYARVSENDRFKSAREADMAQFENDEFLNSLVNRRGGRYMGIDMARQMPYYSLYDSYISKQIVAGRKQSRYKDYLRYSIGFLTRGCFRKCPFCVNRLETKVVRHSGLEHFLDNERDERGRLKRPYIYLWDDNFLAAPPSIWRPLLKELMDTKRPFQFRQGLDERIIAESPYGEEIAETLSRCRYHGDYIFAFDNWNDRDKIEKALKIWKKYNKKETKFYLFCGFKLNAGDDERLYNDVWEIFARIRILMRYGCLGYIMRHEDYHNHELSNIYVQIARWCNQPAFYKKMSFWEFCYRNQTFWEERTLGLKVQPLKTYEEFRADLAAGVYAERKICRPLNTILKFMDKYRMHESELLDFFNMKLRDLVNPQLWNK